MLGLAFKPDTGDTRNSCSILVIEGLQECNAGVVTYGPVAAENMNEHLPDISYASSPSIAFDGAVATLVVTDYEEITELNEEFDAVTTPVVIDSRRAITAVMLLSMKG